MTLTVSEQRAAVEKALHLKSVHKTRVNSRESEYASKEHYLQSILHLNLNQLMRETFFEVTR